MAYCYGWNIPGAMTGSLCEDAETFEKAQLSLLWEIERWDADRDCTSAQLARAAEEVRGLSAGADAEVICGAYSLFIEARDEPDMRVRLTVGAEVSETTLAAFLDANTLEPEQVAEIRAAFDAGQPYQDGGGAAPIWTLERA